MDTDAKENILKRHGPFIIPIAAYFVLVAPFINQLPMHEEVIHLLYTDSWEHTLKYYGHPPLYVFLIRLVREFFSDSYQAVYVIGIMSFIIDVYLIGRIVDRMFKDSPQGTRSKIKLAGMWMFVLMPIAIQGSLLLEMENTVLTPLCLLSILYYFNKDQDSNIHYIKLGLLIGVSMWAKFFATPLILIAAIFLSESIWNKAFLQPFKKTAVILASALSFFVPTYLTYSYFFLEGYNTFTFLIFSKTQEGIPLFIAGKFVTAVLSKLIAFFFWYSPFFIALLLYLVFFIRKRRMQTAYELFLSIVISLIFLFYLLLHPYPFAESKYFFPIFPLIAVLAVSHLKRSGFRPPNAAYLLIIPVASLLNFYVLGDPLRQLLYYYRVQAHSSSYAYLGLYTAFNIILFTAVFIIVRCSTKNRHDALCSTLVVLFLSAWFSLIANQSLGHYQTKYQYGETGADEAVGYVKAHIPPKSNVILPGEIAYYSGVVFANQGVLLRDFNSQADSKYEWVIERRVNILRLPKQDIDLLSANYDLITQRGSYQFYKLKTQ